MCRVLKVLIVAPAEMHADLRRRLSSLEYEIVAVASGLGEVASVTADVALVWEPDAETVRELKERGAKVVAVGGCDGADLSIGADEIGAFKQRVWELFRPR